MMISFKNTPSGTTVRNWKGLVLIDNGNRTEWSPIRSVIILRGRPIC